KQARRASKDLYKPLSKPVAPKVEEGYSTLFRRKMTMKSCHQFSRRQDAENIETLADKIKLSIG
ncbi:MAG: hypothetical protein ACR2GD_08020, partial [Pyrinomonadaceae bacterium]